MKAARFLNPLRMAKALALTLGLWGAGVSPALAWWETGHMMTAQVAYDNLRPDVKAKADKLIAWLDNAEPMAARHHFVPVAVWMDETKARDLRIFDNWHYINIPYNADGRPFIPDAQAVNIVSVMESMAKTLGSAKASEFEKAFALRVLLHQFGDIHQPFHAVGKVSHENPEGDLGGNKTLIQFKDMKNIHAFWDSTATLFPQVKSEEWQTQIPGLSAELQKKQPRSKFAADLNFKPAHWAEESFALAVKNGYETLPVNGQLDAAYIAKAQEICAQRIAQGGYRLAELLNNTL